MNFQKRKWFINNNYIDCCNKCDQESDFISFTLEDFLEKFPYKVGDKVNYVKYNDENPDAYTIQKVLGNGVTIEYLLDSSGFSALTKDLQPYKPTIENINKEQNTMEEKIESFEILESHCADEVKIEFDPSKFELVQRENGWFVIKKKPKYPTILEECCKLLGIEYLDFNTKCYKRYLLDVFQKLLICRDAYWEIAGEEMGLGKFWEPDWKDVNETFFTIAYDGINIKLYNNTDVYAKFAFPTAEMRDAFYENFKELIDQCKELL